MESNKNKLDSLTRKIPNIVNKKNGPLMNFAWVFIFFDDIRA